MKLYQFNPIDIEEDSVVIVAARGTAQAIRVLEKERELEDYSDTYEEPVRIVKGYALGKPKIIATFIQ